MTRAVARRSGADAIQAARRAGVNVFSIGMQGPQLTPGPLRALARATGGTYYEAARSAELGRAYLRQLQRGARANLGVLRYFTTKRPGEEGLRIDVDAGRLGVTQDGVRLIPKSTAAGPVTGAHGLAGLRSRWWGAAVIGGLVGLLLLEAWCGSCFRKVEEDLAAPAARAVEP